MNYQLDAYKTERSAAITFRNVNDPERWPKADSGRCSIFEAVNIVGAAKFGQEWTTFELSALYWNEQPKDAEARRLAVLQRAKLRPKPPPPSPTIGSRLIRVPNDPDYRAHVSCRNAYLIDLAQQQAVLKEQQRWEKNNEHLARLVSATEWLAGQCRDASLQTYYRFQVGGALLQMQPSDWNIEDPLRSFVAAGGYERGFLNEGKYNRWPVFIFFDREQLARAVSVLSYAPAVVSTTSLDSLSPYLALAVKLAIARGYNSPGAAETQPVREAEVTAAWEAALPGIPPSKKAIEAIAKVMGFPNPAAILQGKSKSNVKMG